MYSELRLAKNGGEHRNHLQSICCNYIIAQKSIFVNNTFITKVLQNNNSCDISNASQVEVHPMANSGQSNYRRGVASLVVLSLLKREDMYGYQLVQETERSSGGELTTQEGSLYPVL